MQTYVKLYSEKENEIYKFLKMFYGDSSEILNSVKEHTLEWKNDYQNPIEMADIIGVYTENNDKFSINMWISLDKDVLVNITPFNSDEIIRYLYERFPY